MADLIQRQREISALLQQQNYAAAVFRFTASELR